MKDIHNHDIAWFIGATMFLIFGGIIAGGLIWFVIAGAGVH